MKREQARFAQGVSERGGGVELETLEGLLRICAAEDATVGGAAGGVAGGILARARTGLYGYMYH